MLRIIYLIGAGATQGEIDHRGGERINLLMRDSKILGDGLATRIIARAEKYKRLNETATSGTETDVEKLISLLDSTGVAKHRAAAVELRRLYRDEILSGLRQTGVLQEPELAIHLLRMHQSKPFSETKEHLVGIVNLNHDWLFQVASQQVYGGIHLGFPFKSRHFKENQKAPLVVQAHGSFNWEDTRPITVGSIEIKNSRDSLWIPPTILKESKEYPYNRLIGVAHEMIATTCDVVRIIGCRLSQNDWNIICLLFNAQYRQNLKRRGCFSVELIMPHKDGEAIKTEYSYLQGLVPIGDLTDGDFSPCKEDPGPGSEWTNPFKYWLRTKTRYHVAIKDIEFDTSLPRWLD